MKSEKHIYAIATDTCYGLACSIDDIKSYEKIYKIKKRSFLKALAILVLDFDWLYEHTNLTEQQVDFLQNYQKPFTILCQCPAIQTLLQFEDDKHFYKNKDVYEKIALRVCHTPEQTKLMGRIWPLFLTSANVSGKPEIRTKQELKKEFAEYEHLIHRVWSDSDIQYKYASDIFEFDWETTNINYLRKKHE